MTSDEHGPMTSHDQTKEDRNPYGLPHGTARPPQRTTRYVYHVHGHAKLHAPSPNPEGPNSASPVVPFEVVLRQALPIESDGAMNDVREDVRGHIVSELDKQGSPYIVGDVMIRGVSHLHTILVEANDPEGPAVRILS